ncbi:hypothetical protein [Corynebacterium cystitidis]|uniref:hypothetical protein n=1 Tax=Corynebacterium cystitidis TaxID=35757 RepID=UPI00211E232F|nr:hypothetical protein [Corynebacterium cystitidis]
MPATGKDVLLRSLAILFVVGVAGPVACSSEADGPPKRGDELAGLLVSVDDINVTGVTRANEAAVDGEEIQPGMGLLPVVGDDNCATAIQAGVATRIQTVGAAARTFSHDNNLIAAGIYSVEDPEAVSVGRLYSDILTYCTEPILHEGTGVEYTVHQLTDPGPDVTGMVVESRSRRGELTTLVVMHRMIGHHAVAVGSTGFTEPTVASVFEAQVEKLEG